MKKKNSYIFFYYSPLYCSIIPLFLIWFEKEKKHQKDRKNKGLFFKKKKTKKQNPKSVFLKKGIGGINFGSN